MPAITCYRIRPEIAGHPVADFSDVVDFSDQPVTSVGPVDSDRFTAQAFVVDSVPHPVSWAGFVQSGFDGLQVGRSMSPSALVVVRARPLGRGRRQPLMFVFAFGVAGRFLLRSDAYERGYGLRTALNLIYPRTAVEAARLRAVDSKRRGAQTMRSRIQASDLTDFEAFDVNRLRDVVNKAIGVPADDGWGHRIGGGDSLTLNLDLTFDQLGDLCRDVERAHAADDYKERFDWIDFIQPVTDPLLLARLEEEVVRRLRSSELDGLGLAPPEIVDWDQVTSFHYHFDRAQGPAGRPVTHPDLRLVDYVAGHSRTGRLDDLDVARLRNSAIRAVDGDGAERYRWTVWRCLTGELAVDGESYILDEGDLFRVRDDYLLELDAAIDGIPISDVVLPCSTPVTHEDEYNRGAAGESR
jgi:uncharacterized protein (TIGR04141 family)